MTGYTIRRVLWVIPVLWAVATITFFLMHAVPGGPFDGNDMPVSEAVRAKLMARLDEPDAFARAMREDWDALVVK